MILYGLKNCDSCRKAMKALPAVEFCDVRVDGVPDAVIDQAVAEFGDRLVNTRSTTWRDLNEKERARPAPSLLKAHPTVMKRPLIVGDGRMTLGWDESVQSKWSV